MTFGSANGNARLLIYCPFCSLAKQIPFYSKSSAQTGQIKTRYTNPAATATPQIFVQNNSSRLENRSISAFVHQNISD